MYAFVILGGFSAMALLVHGMCKSCRRIVYPDHYQTELITEREIPLRHHGQIQNLNSQFEMYYRTVDQVHQLSEKRPVWNKI